MVWFISHQGIPKLGYTLTLNDSACVGFEPNPCDNYHKLVKIDEPITVLGRKYLANVYDWIFEFNKPVLGYRRYIVNHIGLVREEMYVQNSSDSTFLWVSKDLLYFISD